jgi:hypothetical protein
VQKGQKLAIKGKRKAVPGLNEKYESIRTESEAKLEAINTELAEIDNKMGPTQAEIARLEDEINRLGHKSELKELKAKLNSFYTEMLKLKPRSPERMLVKGRNIENNTFLHSIKYFCEGFWFLKHNTLVSFRKSIFFSSFGHFLPLPVRPRYSPEIALHNFVYMKQDNPIDRM